MTNVNDNETNGIHYEITLPEGDAVKELREFIDDQFVSGKTAWTQGMALADMVERDYVSREAYEDLRDEFVWVNTFLHRIGKQCGTKDVPSLKAYVEQLEAERDELQRKIEILKAHGVEIVDAVAGGFEVYNEAVRERDEWKAKAEQAMESYADAKAERDAWMEKFKQAELRSNDGVTNLEWLYEHDRDALIAMAATHCDCEHCAYCETEKCVEDVRYGENDCYGGCCEWLMAPHANDTLSAENDVSANDVDANDANVTQDSRKQLEADAMPFIMANAERCGGVAFAVIEFGKLLDRQTTITERHWMEIVGASANCNLELTNQIAELQEKVDEQRKSLEAAWEDNAELITKVDALTQANSDYREEWHRVCRERDELQRKLHESNREREQLRKQLGIAIDHAHDMIALVSLDGDTE